MTTGYALSVEPLLSVLYITVFAAVAFILFLLTLRLNTFKALSRFFFSLLIVLFLFNPQLAKENRQPIKDVALIAIDKSQSMNFSHRAETSKKILTHLRAELGKIPNLEVRSVDVAASASDETKIFDAIEPVLSDVPENQRAGIVVITDGQVVDRPSNDSLKAAPLHVLLAGSHKDRDREIQIINAPGYSTIGDAARLKFRIEDHNIASAGTASVILSLPDGTTQTQDVPIGQDQEWQLPINTAGQNIFELSVGTLPSEISNFNNHAVINVQGIRSRLRVLLVSGEPYPGGRMWRDLLKADPSVDLVHFTILRSPEKIDLTPPNELSLIAFPFDELFQRKLSSFDLIIMDRFSLNIPLPDFYFQNLKNYVLNGGALLEIDGPTYASQTSIYKTALGSILPGAPNGEIIESSFKPAITALGKSHPITMPLTKIPDWGPWLHQMPVTPLTGDVLMSGANNNPLLIVSRQDKGRVAELTSDQIWLWARGYQGGGPTTELLRRVVHWLMKEPELDETALDIKNQGSDISIRTRDNAADTAVHITHPDGSQTDLPLSKGEDGWLSAGLKNTSNGIYKFNIGNRTKIISLGDMTKPEYSNIVTTDQNLLSSAQISGGSLLWAEDHPDFTVKSLTRQNHMGGSDWIGLKRNDSTSLLSSERRPLMPPSLMLLLGLIAGLAMWWLESRISIRPSRTVSK